GLVVRGALERGHDVVAFVRDPAKLRLQDTRLSVVKGDVFDYDDVLAAVSGSSAVISALGTGSGVSVCTEAAKNIVRAMKESGVRRLICVSVHGVGDTRGSGFFPWLAWAVLRNVMEDKERMEEVIRASDLDWTTVRPTALTGGRRTGKYRVGARPGLLSRISRADVADFILQQLDDRSFIRRAPTVTG
ncbi:MAG: SDR family oxidoreductase, partial [Nitrososphaerota archaeon]|nr:SDR family oxidoreductase [Nitrososphaerota archaeon]